MGALLNVAPVLTAGSLGSGRDEECSSQPQRLGGQGHRVLLPGAREPLSACVSAGCSGAADPVCRKEALSAVTCA